MPKDAAPAIGSRMAKARTDRGVTQVELAKRLGVRQAMVSMIEAGEAEYSDELGKRIKSWIDSGEGPKEKAPRGPYAKARTTLPKR